MKVIYFCALILWYLFSNHETVEAINILVLEGVPSPSHHIWYMSYSYPPIHRNLKHFFFHAGLTKFHWLLRPKVTMLPQYLPTLTMCQHLIYIFFIWTKCTKPCTPKILVYLRISLNLDCNRHGVLSTPLLALRINFAKEHFCPPVGSN